MMSIKMDTGLVDLTGFPIGQLYLAIRVEARERGTDLHSDAFQNNRKLFLDVGVPERRIRTTTAKLICTRLAAEYKGIPIDVLSGINLPDVL